MAQTTNSMMASILAKRNQMKKVGGAGAGTSTTVKPPSKPTASVSTPGGTTIAPKPNLPGTGGAPKPGPKSVTNTAPKPTTGALKPTPKPPTTGGARPPMKVGGGGGRGFAAKMAALQGRMAGQEEEEEDQVHQVLLLHLQVLQNL